MIRQQIHQQKNQYKMLIQNQNYIVTTGEDTKIIINFIKHLIVNYSQSYNDR